MREKRLLTFTVNGIKQSLSYIEGEFLAELLRDRLGLTGTKIGCDEGVRGGCGTCTVLVDGKPIRSCKYPAKRVDGKAVLTIEGLSTKIKKDLHPLQEAFIKYGAVQCGFCTPGQIMNAYALLQKEKAPSRDQIRRSLQDTLCRCGTYPAIEHAVEAAAYSLRTGEPIPEPKLSMTVKESGIGSVQTRPDAIEKVTGAAKFTADLKFPGMLYARVKRAEVPHAILHSVDVEKAKQIPGVVAVIVAEDLPGAKKHGYLEEDWPILIGVGERVRYVGDAVALVAAETGQVAAQALEAIQLDLEPCEVITSPIQAHSPTTPRLHTQGNVLKHIEVRKGDIELGLESSDIVLKRTYYTPAMDHAFLERECSLARITKEGRMEVYVGSQNPCADRRQVAGALGWEEEQVRIIGNVIGGAFGGKVDIAGQIHAALLTKETHRPVKLEYSRKESLMAHPKRHATQITITVGAGKDGRLKVIKTKLYGDTGAYACSGKEVMERAAAHSSGAYEISNFRADSYAMYTNNPPAGAFRGFGALQAVFATECMMDLLSVRLGMEPIELRRINALRVGSVTNTGQTLNESVGLLACIDKVDEELHKVAGDAPFSSKKVPGSDHVRRAWGFAVAYKNVGFGGGVPDQASAEVELLPDGSFEVRTSSPEVGQGLVVVLQMIVADQFNLRPAEVNVLLMDTEFPDGGPSAASRQTYMVGNAVRFAAKELKEKIQVVLSEKYKISSTQVQFNEGKVHLGKTEVSFQDAAKLLLSQGQSLSEQYQYSAPETKPLEEGGDLHYAYGFSAQAAEVEVDTQRGTVKVLRVITANDVGKVINPLGLQGQVEGGVIMGVGHALTEHFELEDGIVKTESLSQYGIPSIAETPQITSFIVEDPISEGPYGAKGVGELVSIPTLPAIANAVSNAVDVEVNRIPITPLWLQNAIYKKK